MSLTDDMERQVQSKNSRVTSYSTVPAKAIVDKVDNITEPLATPTVEEVTAANDFSSLIGREGVFEKNFARQTYYVHKELIKAIDKMAKRGGKGAKTKLINEAIQAFVKEKTKK